MIKNLTLIIVILISISSVNAIYCYQENINTATATDGNCGQVYGGSYTVFGTWTSSSAFYDKNWNVGASTSIGTGQYIQAVYTLPSGASTTGNLWQVKDALGTVNLSINNSCLVTSTITVRAEVGSCFSKDTIIKTLLGDKLISDIIVGDFVLSYDELSKTNTYSEVLQIFFHPKNESNDLIIINKKFYVTTNHPLYLNGKWNNSENAKVGDILLDYLGNNITIETLTYNTKKEDTYNFEVDNTHNYYASGFLVHNKGGVPLWRCLGAGATWYTLRAPATTTTFYEEAMIWNYTPTPQCTNYTKTDNVLFIWKGCYYNISKGGVYN